MCAFVSCPGDYQTKKVWYTDLVISPSHIRIITTPHEMHLQQIGTQVLHHVCIRGVNRTYVWKVTGECGSENTKCWLLYFYTFICTWWRSESMLCDRRYSGSCSGITSRIVFQPRIAAKWLLSVYMTPYTSSTCGNLDLNDKTSRCKPSHFKTF